MATDGPLIFVYSLQNETPLYYKTLYTEEAGMRAASMELSAADGLLLVPSADGVYFFDGAPSPSRFAPPVRHLSFSETLGFSCQARRLLVTKERLLVSSDNGVLHFFEESVGLHSLLCSENGSPLCFLELLPGAMLATLDTTGEFVMWQVPKKWRSAALDAFEAEFRLAVTQLAEEKRRIEGP